jgi:hypothetical protein
VGRSALHELVGDDRAYLSLWNARREGVPGDEEFLAVHKAAIQYVVVIGEDDTGLADES